MRTIFRSLLVVLLQTLLLVEAAHAAPGGTPADLSLSDITGASNYFVGQTVFFQITLSDLGPNPSSNVVVNTTLPVGLAFVSAVFSPGESYDETANLWYVTNLPTSSPVTLYLAARVQSVGPWTNTATIISSSTTDPVSSNNTTSATITGIPAPPPANLTIFKSANVTNVFVGGEVDFQIIVTNLGTVDASNILVTETLPSGLSLLSADVFNSASSFDSSSGVWSITNLVAGDSVTLIVSAQVNSPGTLTNTASILLSSPSNTNTANRASATVTGMPVTGSTPEADLAITKTASTSVVQTGDVVSFTLTVTNLGPDDASNVVVQEYMPNAIGTLGATAPGGTTYDVNAQQWLIPFLGNGQSISLVITGQVAESDEGGDTITEYANTATIVASLPYDPDLDNNSATVTLTTPLAETSVALAKTADQSSILIGGTVNFSITITNIGPDAVPQATVEDDMPAGLQVSGWTAPPGTGYDPGTGLWSITNLPSSSSLTLVISAIGTVAGTQINTAEITALDALDTGGLNHQASATVLVTVSQYTINSSAGPGGSVSPVGSFLVNGGDSVTFTATPQTGYQVSTWSLDGVAVQTGGLTYYLPEIQASHSVQVTFTPMSFCSGLQLAVNFVDPANAGTEMMSPDDLAGAVVQPGWVNAIGPSGSVPLTTGATVTWGAPGTASLAPVGLSPDFTMMQGYLSCIGGSSVINVSGINLPSYDVYVYCAGNNLPGETRVGRYTLNGGTSLYAQDVAGLLDFDGSYVQSTSATGGPGAAIGNYVVFHNVTGSSFILTAQGDSTSGTFLDAPVNGLQIVPSSGSTAPSLPVPLRFTSISPTGSNTIHTVLTGTPGTPIEVDVSSNLVNWEQRFFLFNSNGVVDLVDTTPTNQSRYYRATQGGAPGDFGDLDYSGGTGDSNSMGQLSFEGGLGNLQFDWQSLDPVLGAMNSGFTLASNVNFYAGTLTCAPRVTFQGTAGGARFNVTMDLKTGGQAIVDVFQTISNVLQQVRFVLTFNIKLDIDADNNNGLGLPDRNAAERKIKDDAAFPGKVVRVNDTDEDNDGIPGFADFDDAAGKQFAEMVLEIPAPIDLTKAQITFTYNASDPAGVLVGGPPAKRVYFPGAGNLRIWTKDAGVARDKTSAGGTGNYIPTEVKMPVSKLGFTGAVRTNVFYVEGIAPGAKPGDQRIVAAVDALGDGTVVFKDAVRVSVVKVSFSRAPTENAAGNKFGYDEMSPAQNDDQVSVAQNDSTFVNVSIQGPDKRRPAGLHLEGHHGQQGDRAGGDTRGWIPVAIERPEHDQGADPHRGPFGHAHRRFVRRDHQRCVSVENPGWQILPGLHHRQNQHDAAVGAQGSNRDERQ